jgi:hypothetical protein
VSVADLTGKTVAAQFTEGELGPLSSLLMSPIERKRDIEDRFVESCIQKNHPAYETAVERIRRAPWYILSARRADRLLRSLLFERVFAMRVRGFAQQFRNAELLHFSLSQDLTKLPEFLKLLRDHGVQRATSMLERGDV